MCDSLLKQFCPFYSDRVPVEKYNYELAQENAWLRQILAENGIDYGWKKEKKKGRQAIDRKGGR